MSKPRVAIFDFASCEGCQLQIVNLEESILKLLSVVDVVEWREAMSESSDSYDIAIVEGSITREADVERLKGIRAKAGILVALGSCAVTGGVTRLKNRFAMSEVRSEVYGKDSNQSQLETAPTKALHEVVKVDYSVLGCPIDKLEFARIVRSLALGREPVLPKYPVCLECKIRENACLWQRGEICLGPLTKAGCQARCPSVGAACVGCRGWAEDANPEALVAVLDSYGKTRADLNSRMDLFLKPIQEAAHA